MDGLAGVQGHDWYCFDADSQYEYRGYEFAPQIPPNPSQSYLAPYPSTLPYVSQPSDTLSLGQQSLLPQWPTNPATSPASNPALPLSPTPSGDSSHPGPSTGAEDDPNNLANLLRCPNGNCGRYYKNEKQMQRHFEKAHGKPVLDSMLQAFGTINKGECRLCGRRFLTALGLSCHYRGKHGEQHLPNIIPQTPAFGRHGHHANMGQRAPMTAESVAPARRKVGRPRKVVPQASQEQLASPTPARLPSLPRCRPTPDFRLEIDAEEHDGFSQASLVGGATSWVFSVGPGPETLSSPDPSNLFGDGKGMGSHGFFPSSPQDYYPSDLLDMADIAQTGPSTDDHRSQEQSSRNLTLPSPGPKTLSPPVGVSRVEFHPGLPHSVHRIPDFTPTNSDSRGGNDPGTGGRQEKGEATSGNQWRVDEPTCGSEEIDRMLEELGDDVTWRIGEGEEFFLGDEASGWDMGDETILDAWMSQGR